MRNKAIAAGVTFALVSTMMLTQMAFAAPPEKQAQDKQTTSDGSRAKNAQAQSDGEQDHKVSICHNGHEISVSRNALPAHGIVVAGETATTGENSSDAVRGHKKHDDTLLSDTGTTEEEGVTEEACQGESTQAEGEPDEVAAAQEENEQSPPQGTSGASQEAGQGEPEDQAKEEVKTCDGGSIELTADENQVLKLHNKARKEQRLQPLCVDPTLQKAARAHSADMIKKDYFGHNSRDGKTSAERLKGLGYNWRATGENIAWGSGSYSEPKSRFEAWMKSEGHRRNILDRKYEEVGVGVAKGNLKKGGKGETVYTVEFASKKR
jgi:uncharacterized protein YkwD